MSNGVTPLVFPPIQPRRDDPAWQPPTDAALRAKAEAGLIVRQIPVSSTQTHWGWSEVRGALDDMAVGMFDRPAQLVEAVMWDARVQAAMGSRTGGLLGRPAKFEAASNSRVKGSSAAKECLDAWQDAWPTISNESAWTNLHAWGVMMFGLAQLLWDTSKSVWVPHVVPFHARYSWYHHVFRRVIAVTLDGQTPVTPGDGHWVMHAPFGEHRGWMRGALAAIAQPWVHRNFTYRDLARFCEKHGFPAIKALSPAGADPAQVQAFRAQVGNLGQESVLGLPQGVDGDKGYDVAYLEAADSTWEVFPQSIQLCDADITLALLGQNLTTEVKEGSFAAARIHGDVRQAFIEFDNRTLTDTIYTQIARPFAALNFGDPDLAPWTTRDVQPYEDDNLAATTLAKFATAMQALRLSGIEMDDPAAFAWTFGINLSKGKPRLTIPTMIETAHVYAGTEGDGAPPKGDNNG